MLRGASSLLRRRDGIRIIKFEFFPPAMRLIGDDPTALLSLLHHHGYRLRTEVPRGGKLWKLVHASGAFYPEEEEEDGKADRFEEGKGSGGSAREGGMSSFGHSERVAQQIRPSHFGALANQFTSRAALGRLFVDIIAERQDWLEPAFGPNASSAGGDIGTYPSNEQAERLNVQPPLFSWVGLRRSFSSWLVGPHST